MSNWNNHLTKLEEAHSLLDKRIDTSEKSGVFEDLQLEEMKKQRLLLKDEIAKLQAQHKGNQ